MAEKSKLGKVGNMKPGQVRYALNKAEANGNVGSKYYDSLKARLAELGERR